MADVIHTRRYRDFRAALKNTWQAANAPCYLCSQPIDYDGPAGAPNSFELEHVHPRKTHPELALEPTNARPSHVRCNRNKSTGKANAGIGTTSEAW
ncbi:MULTISPECIES: HNH endonuclease [unclassified Microbacterium]|uniref:HNH endonuclease n=1 Tax=Microbacterium TaxID=33882 RepID=UPI003BA1EBEB